MSTTDCAPSPALTSTVPAWDGYDAYLFDIDGTLINCQDAVHYFAFCNALSATVGKPLNLDGVVAHGNTDVGILRDAFARAGVEDALWRPRLAEIRSGMCAEVRRNQADLRIEVLPAVKELLAHLRERGAVLGVATGNLEGIGHAKLQQAGLWEFFHFGGFSDAHEYRCDVFRAALGHALACTHAGARVCVVGDTPEDIRAAQANGLDVIAVATGIFPLRELADLKPTRCVASLASLLESGAGA